MRLLLVLAIAIPVLLAFGAACGGDQKEAQVTPSAAGESEGQAEEAEEAEEWDREDVAEEEEEAEETDTEEAGEEEAGEEEEEELEACWDGDFDGVCVNDLCQGTAAGSVVDEVGCSDAQVDHDNDGICDPRAESDGPGDCDLVDDNCPTTPNAAQEDFDGDHKGDVCDRDDDGDYFTDVQENAFGSDPLDSDSVPEDEAGNPASCFDGVDNDQDGDADGADDGCF